MVVGRVGDGAEDDDPAAVADAPHDGVERRVDRAEPGGVPYAGGVEDHGGRALGLVAHLQPGAGQGRRQRVAVGGDPGGEVEQRPVQGGAFGRPAAQFGGLGQAERMGGEPARVEWVKRR